ncbi:keratin, type II cytoskeletal 2 epidermal-like [Empidonax traillii]|uniref:keratin, type II cytoskeletal 2 epidermal-like n=1 Tax=Empidonax traillii TaxID=164674 RepID=UPI000FFD2ABA|nr:keratin, type II cytoskeletal 2 epidermal-like [Empidonax traillii]
MVGAVRASPLPARADSEGGGGASSGGGGSGSSRALPPPSPAHAQCGPGALAGAGPSRCARSAGSGRSSGLRGGHRTGGSARGGKRRPGVGGPSGSSHRHRVFCRESSLYVLISSISRVKGQVRAPVPAPPGSGSWPPFLGGLGLEMGRDGKIPRAFPDGFAREAEGRLRSSHGDRGTARPRSSTFRASSYGSASTPDQE